jgi:hypothetical protein
MNLFRQIFIFTLATMLCINTTQCTSWENITLTEWTQRCFHQPEFNHVVLPKKDFPQPMIEAGEFIQLLNVYMGTFIHNQFFVNDPSLLNKQVMPNPRYFAEKTFLNSGYVATIGDLHGSVHSLTRNLWQLVKDPNIRMDNNFKIADNARFIITGDSIDRGHYSVECLALLARIFIANPDKVFLVRGNHEHKTITSYQQQKTKSSTSATFTFFDEINCKYPDPRKKTLIKNLSNAMMQTMPIFLTLHAGAPEALYNILFCHGGIPVYFETETNAQGEIAFQTLYSKNVPEFINNLGQPVISEISPEAAKSFTLSDFSQPGTTNGTLFPNFFRGNCCIADTQCAFKCMASQKINLIIRGHQHGLYGLKLLFKNQNELDQYLFSKIIDYFNKVLGSHGLSNEGLIKTVRDSLITKLENKFSSFCLIRLFNLDVEKFNQHKELFHETIENILMTLKERNTFDPEIIPLLRKQFTYKTKNPHEAENSFFELITNGDQSYKGPVNWKTVVSDEDYARHEFNINKYTPIFTLSSATEGLVVTGDTVAILHITPSIQDCTVKIYDTNFYKNSGMPIYSQNFACKYSSITAITDNNFTNIQVLHEDQPAQIPVSQSLIDQAIANVR